MTRRLGSCVPPGLMVETERQPDWWAHGGSERCPRCLQLYAYEVEIRCVECDGPLCPFCAVLVAAAASALRCADCPDVGEEP